MILTGRRADRLEALAASLGVPVLPLVFDVRNADETERFLGNLPKAFADVDVLINNAGLAAGLDPIQDGNPDHWNRMMDTNVKGLLHVTRVVVQGMKARKEGHIINIGSIAGKETYANGAVYCASKHAVEALTKGMRLDLLPFGIKVSQVSPGLVETEFSLVRFEGNAQKAELVYRDMEPLTGADVADVVSYMVHAPRHVNLADVLLLPTAQGNATTVFRGS